MWRILCSLASHGPKVSSFFFLLFFFRDEPTIGLTVMVKDNIRHTSLQITRWEEETTILLTTHDLSGILSNSVIDLRLIRARADGTVSQLKEHLGKMKTFLLTYSGVKII